MRSRGADTHAKSSGKNAVASHGRSGHASLTLLIVPIVALTFTAIFAGFNVWKIQHAEGGQHAQAITGDGQVGVQSLNAPKTGLSP